MFLPRTVLYLLCTLSQQTHGRKKAWHAYKQATSLMAKTKFIRAQEVISELLNCVVDQLTPSQHLAEVEGDVLLVYVPQSQLARKETLLELIETAYVAFWDRLVGMR